MREAKYGVILRGRRFFKLLIAMTSLLELPLILKRLLQTFMEDMFINTSSVMLLAPAGAEFQVFLADGEQKESVEKVALKQDNPLMEIISVFNGDGRLSAITPCWYSKLTREEKGILEGILREECHG
jgi:hypothetical protein